MARAVIAYDKDLLEAKRTVFNYVTNNDYERRLAVFLDKARDVLRFASLGTTEQGPLRRSERGVWGVRRSTRLTGNGLRAQRDYESTSSSQGRFVSPR